MNALALVVVEDLIVPVVATTEELIDVPYVGKGGVHGMHSS
jgi:hypothetical protein